MANKSTLTPKLVYTKMAGHDEKSWLREQEMRYHLHNIQHSNITNYFQMPTFPTRCSSGSSAR